MLLDFDLNSREDVLYQDIDIEMPEIDEEHYVDDSEDVDNLLNCYDYF